MRVFLILIGFAIACAGCRGGAGRRTYVARITAERVAKDAVFKTQSEPIPANLKNQLLPLVYYSPDPSYDVFAVLRPSTDAKTLQMVYSDGAIRDVRRVGTLEFILNGKRFRLAAFVEVAARDANDVFVPFGDLTNSTETYHGGRMLDVRRTNNDLYFLDFNEAFNPSCYYSPTYSCPLAPKENRLPIAIRAGEKIRIERWDNPIMENVEITMERPTLGDLPASAAMPTGCIIRGYQTGDEVSWTRIQAEADRYNVITSSLFSREFGDTASHLTARVLFAVVPKAGLIGTATAWWGSSPTDRWGRVHWVAVLPEWQRRGIGRNLLLAVCNQLRQLGHEGAFLTTSPARLEALRLYRSLEFVPRITALSDSEIWREIASQLEDTQLKAWLETRARHTS